MQSSEMPDEPEVHGNGKRKRKKPYAIEWMWDSVSMWTDWATYKRYEKKEDRDRVFKSLRHGSLDIEYRIVD